jgi:hypothetical protein
MLCEHVVYTCYERATTHVRPPNAGYATSECDAKKARRADADYATSERNGKRARRADADYATSDCDAKRARRADADQKNDSNPMFSGCVFIVRRPTSPNAAGKVRRIRNFGWGDISLASVPQLIIRTGLPRVTPSCTHLISPNSPSSPNAARNLRRLQILIDGRMKC